MSKSKTIAKCFAALCIPIFTLLTDNAHADAAPGDRKPIGIGISDGKTTVGLKFLPPDEDGWSTERKGLSVTLTKNGKLPGENQQIEAYMMKPDVSADSISNFVSVIKTNTQEGYKSSKKFKLTSLDVQADPKNPRCVRSHILLEDIHASSATDNPDKKWSEQYVLSCGLSNFKTYGFELRYYQRYRDANKDVQFAEKANTLFESVVIEDKISP